MHRRHVFLQISRAAATLAWQQLFAPRAQAQGAASTWVAPASVFALGVASGEPRPDSVVLWTRLAPQPMRPDGGMPAQPIPVGWEVALDAGFAQVIRSGSVQAWPDRAHAVHLEVGGLAPAQTYYYRFTSGGQTSRTGRTRTAPDPQALAPRLRMAMASCQHYEAGHFTMHREMAAADLDLVLFLGDYLYETRMPGHLLQRCHPHQFPRNPQRYTLDDYRLHHASYKLDADLQANHAAHPWLLVWDDHDVLNDYTGDHSEAFDEVAPFLALRTAAYRAFFEHLPLSPKRMPMGALMPMHERYEWGQLAEIWAVDTRQYRSARPCAARSAWKHGLPLWHCDALGAADRTMLGSQQEDWLSSGLAVSTRAWKFIAQSTQVCPGGLRTPWGPIYYADGWDAFPEARARLMAAIGQPRVPDVVCLGGDVHRHVVANLRLNPFDRNSPIVASEIVTTSITSRGLSELLNAWMRSSNPDLLHMRSDQRGYAILDVTPSQVLCEFRATAHPVAPDAASHVQARYAIMRGVPGPRRVSDKA